MLINTKIVTGHKLAASDGDIGRAEDFYFDDQTWALRYLVADTGTWLTGRQVLLSPYCFGRFDGAEKMIRINLTRKQIEGSPSIDTHRPVSRQYEENYYRYYGWPLYWEGGNTWGRADFPAMAPAIATGGARTYEYARWDDIHLRSIKKVTGYQVEATDGTVGTVSGFMVDDKRWVIRELVIETGHWYAGKEVLIAPTKVQRVSYEASKVFVNLSKVDIQTTAENHLVRAVA